MPDMLVYNIPIYYYVGLLPTIGMVKPTDKTNLVSLLSDVEAFNRKRIDVYTGQLYTNNEVYIYIYIYTDYS